MSEIHVCDSKRRLGEGFKLADWLLWITIYLYAKYGYEISVQTKKVVQ